MCSDIVTIGEGYGSIRVKHGSRVTDVILTVTFELLIRGLRKVLFNHCSVLKQMYSHLIMQNAWQSDVKQPRSESSLIYISISLPFYPNAPPS